MAPAWTNTQTRFSGSCSHLGAKTQPIIHMFDSLSCFRGECNVCNHERPCVGDASLLSTEHEGPATLVRLLISVKPFLLRSPLNLVCGASKTTVTELLLAEFELPGQTIGRHSSWLSIFSRCRGFLQSYCLGQQVTM